METIGVILIISCCITLFTEVDSKYCPYPNEKNLRITCASYEYCCARGCCRSPTLTFYQLWYFWLSVILILLLCSGGGWWYRFKYRNHIYTQQTGGPGTNAFYYPSTDRVFFQNSYKDHRYTHRPYLAQMTYNTQPTPTQQPLPPQMFSCAPPPPIPGFRHPHPSAFGGTPAPPPPYTGPPPSYDSILHQGKG